MPSFALSNAAPTKRDFLSSDPGETLDYVGRTLVPHRMDVGDPAQMSAKLSCFEIAPAQIVDIQYGTDVWIDPGAIEGHYLIHAALAGGSTRCGSTICTSAHPADRSRSA